MSAEAPTPTVAPETSAAPVTPVTPATELGTVMDRARASDIAAAAGSVVPPTPPAETPEPPATETPAALLVEPPVAESAVEETAPPATPRLAAIYDLGSPSSESFASATTIVRDYADYDPVGAENLLHGVYYANEARIQTFALQRLGVPQAKVNDFVAWAKAGAPALPQPATAPPFPEVARNADGSLVLDENGEQLVRLPSGRVINVADDIGAETYDNSKASYNAAIAERAREADSLANEQRLQTERAEAYEAFQDDCFTSARTAYLDDLQATVRDLVTPAVANLGPDDKPFGEDFEAGILANVVNGPAITKIGEQAYDHLQAIVTSTVKRCLAEGHSPDATKQAVITRLKGSRMAEFAEQQKQIIRREINLRKDAFLKRMLRLNKAELAAVGTDPVTTNITPVTTTAPPPRVQGPRSLDSLLTEAGEHDRRAAQAR